MKLKANLPLFLLFIMLCSLEANAGFFSWLKNMFSEEELTIEMVSAPLSIAESIVTLNSVNPLTPGDYPTYDEIISAGSTLNLTVDINPPANTAAGSYDFSYTTVGDEYGAGPPNISATVNGIIQIRSFQYQQRSE